MLRSIKKITGYTLNALDDEIGRCADFLFDDNFWTVRYMVADTGKWLPGRLVLISPISLDEPRWTDKSFPVRLTKKQIEDAPGFDEAKPVSRQHEIEYFGYYGWPFYWEGTHLWGATAFPGPLFDKNIEEKNKQKVDSDDKHLRSVNEVTGYHIKATDDEIGHVEDFIINDENWMIQYMIVDTRNWLPGKKVLVAPDWIDSIDWSERKVYVGLTREQIKDCPEFDPAMPINREYEENLYDFYGRPKYWI